MANTALAIHGGAGTIDPASMTPELEAAYRGGLEAALKAGWGVLSSGGSAVDAAELAVRHLEDNELFNAGRGSVFNHHGKNEMDAAIMDGGSLKAGAVAAVHNVKNPVSLARAVLEKSPHILLSGDGATEFAEEMKIELVDNTYLYTDRRWNELEEAIKTNRIQLDHSGGTSAPAKGTVGAVACDANGRLAAATSTGGLTNKRYGRIGDTPLIGAGTYADTYCAVSCTGWGEFFMLGVTAYDVAARMRYQGVSLADAANAVIERQTEIGGDGGLIAVDAAGNIAMPFNSTGMYRGSVTAAGVNIGIYR
jgi:beta-aspartyl-peptidase (threonine type)